jgi:hypothetical protein
VTDESGHVSGTWAGVPIDLTPKQMRSLRRLLNSDSLRRLRRAAHT